MSTRVVIELSESGIKDAIKKLEEYKKKVNEKTRALLEQLSLVGINEASVRFTGAQYDGINDVRLSTQESSEGTSYVYTILAEGEAVCFIEFGAGVYYNSAAYPGDKPEGVVGIGEYGDKHGKQNYWGFYGDYPGSNGWVIQNGKGRSVVITHGNPAAMPMYYASSEMKQRILSIAREVFSS